MEADIKSLLSTRIGPYIIRTYSQRLSSGAQRYTTEIDGPGELRGAMVFRTTLPSDSFLVRRHERSGAIVVDHRAAVALCRIFNQAAVCIDGGAK